MACCGCPFRTAHWFAHCPATTTTLCWPCHASFLNKSGFVLFFYFLWHSHPDKGWASPVTNLYGRNLVIPAHVYLFWARCHFSRTFPPKEFEREPKNRIPLLPTARPHPLLPLTHGPPPLYWLGTGRWCLSLVCVLYFHISPLLFWYSCVCDCLQVCLTLC